MALEEPMVGGPEDQVEDYVGVGAGRDLAPSDRPFHECLVLGAQGFEHPLAPRQRQFRVPLRLCDKTGQHATGVGFCHGPGPGPQCGQQVASERACVRERELAAELRHERVERQRTPGRPAPVDGGLPHPGAGGDLLHRHPG